MADNLPVKSQFRGLADCKTLAEALNNDEFKRRVKEAVPSTVISGEAMLQAFTRVSAANALLMKADLRQVLGAMMSLAWLGLPPGGHLGLAHLIPFKRQWNPIAKRKEEWIEVQVIIGYAGYIDLACRSGIVSTISPGLVFPGEKFRYVEGAQLIFEHEPDIDAGTEGKTPRAAYAVAHYKDGSIVPVVMPWPDVLAIRNRSQGYRAAQAALENAKEKGNRPPSAYTDSPWVRDPLEMAKKTAIRRLAKILPRCPDLRAGVSIEDRQDRAPLDFGPVIDGSVTPTESDLPVAESDEEAEAEFTMRAPAAPQHARTTVDVRPVDVPAPDETEVFPFLVEPQAVQHQEPPLLLLDAAGDILSEPVLHTIEEWATAFTALYDETFPPDRLALVEHNADLVAQAKAHGFGVLPPEAAPDPMVTVGVPPARGGKPSWGQWLSAYRTAIVSVPNDLLPQWLELQHGTLVEAPFAQRMQALRASASRFVDAAIAMPPWTEELAVEAQQPTPPPPETEDEWATRIIAEFGRCTTDRQLLEQAALYRDKMTALGKESAIYQRVLAAVVERRRALADA